MNFKRQKTNLVFLSLILIMLVYITLTVVQGYSQNDAFMKENRDFLVASNLINQGRNGQAEPLLDKLLDNHQDSYVVLWNYAMVLFDRGDFNGAKDFYERAMEQRPFLGENATFLAQYGQLLYRLEQYHEAQKWLKNALKINPQLSEGLQPILNDIEKKIDEK